MTAARPSVSTAPEDRLYIVNRIKQLIRSRHINVSNPSQDYRPWLDLIDERSEALIRCANEREFERGVREVVNGLGSSHTTFFHLRNDDVPAPYSINATLREV